MRLEPSQRLKVQLERLLTAAVPVRAALARRADPGYMIADIVGAPDRGARSPGPASNVRGSLQDVDTEPIDMQGLTPGPRAERPRSRAAGALCSFTPDHVARVGLGRGGP